MSSIKNTPEDEPFCWKEILRYCLPALIAAIVLRTVIMVYMPYAFTISDTREFVGTSISLTSSGFNPFKETSRTFLAKLLYAVPVFVNQPILPWVAFIQHLIGLAGVVAAGVLCRLWLTRWRWWIIPLTLIVAVHPTLLWYEHMSLPDGPFISFVLLSSAFGGLYYRRPSGKRLAALAISLILTASARQEGFLFLGFGVLLVVSRQRQELWAGLQALRSGKGMRLVWRDLGMAGRHLAVILAIFLFAYSSSKTTQGGQMLLTSTIHMAPDRLWFTPDFSEIAVQLRDRFQSRWPAYPGQHNKSRKIITGAVGDYLAAKAGDPSKANGILDRDNNRLCKRVGLEIALRNWWKLPGMAFNKFRATHLEPPSPDFGDAWAHTKHSQVFFGKSDDKKLPKDFKYQKVYYGREFKTRDEALAAFKEMYRVDRLTWLLKFQRAFVNTELGWKTPDLLVPFKNDATDDPSLGVSDEDSAELKVPISGKKNFNDVEFRKKGQILPGVSMIYLFGFVGLLIALTRSREWFSYRQLWIFFLLFEAFAVFATGSLRSRYRLIYEPWWFLGLFCILDAAVAFLRGGWKVWRDGDHIETDANSGHGGESPKTPAAL